MWLRSRFATPSRPVRLPPKRHHRPFPASKQTAAMPATPFHLELSRANGVSGYAAATAKRAVAWALGLQACAKIYAQLHTPSDEPFDARVLRALHITPECDPAGLLAVPSSGPLVVAANHPHGVLDGLLLASLIRSVRPDVRILANHLLARIPELSDLCFYADPFGGASAGRRSLAGLRAAQRWLVCGGSADRLSVGRGRASAPSRWLVHRLELAPYGRPDSGCVWGAGRAGVHRRVEPPAILCGRPRPSAAADRAARARAARQARPARVRQNGTVALRPRLVELRKGWDCRHPENSRDGGGARRRDGRPHVELVSRPDVTRDHAPPARSTTDAAAATRVRVRRRAR